MKAWHNKKLNRYQVERPDGSMTFRYRYLMELHLGRRLGRDEHVHHLNGDPTDDRIENLAIVSPSEHAQIHAADISAGKRNHQWAARHTACMTCGRVDRKHQGRGLCSYCYFQDRERVKRGRKPHVPRQYVSKVCPTCEERFTLTMSSKNQLHCSRACLSAARQIGRAA
jgi:hypothetical protein